MNMKHCIWILMVLLSAAAFPVHSGEDTPTLDNTRFDRPQRPPAVFDHDDHNSTAGLDDKCSVCHHVYENGKLIEDESSEDSLCSECHGLSPTPENPVSLRRAFHTNCRSCHFESGKGPVLCGECHKNK